MNIRKFDKIRIFKLTEKDDTMLRALATKLDLPVSETLRRSLRLGAMALRRIRNFPGSRRCS
jgi:hypothetical protein